MDSVSYDLPSLTYEAGKIYTVTVVNNTEGGATEKIKATLKAISPFNIDTAKKMWSFNDSLFLYKWDDNNNIKPVIKTAYTKQDGSIIMGPLKDNPALVGFIKINQYGKYFDPKVFSAMTNSISAETVKSVSVVDFVEQSDGSIIMLLSCTSDDDSVDLLVAYDFTKRSKLWEFVFPEPMQFRFDSADKLLLLQDNKVAVVGAVWKASEGSEVYDCMSPYVGIFDYTSMSTDKLSYLRNEGGCKSYIMSDQFENESLFSSSYYDGTNLYACGFTEFNPEYNPVTHTGIIYKFNDDLSNPQIIYSKERCLFFTISGSNNNWYVCGEYCKENETKLVGCYVSSSMINKDSNTNPVYYFGAKDNTWYNQLCTYNNMIVMCGQSSKDTKGKDSPLPFVVAFDSDGNQLWENLSYKKWATALNIIPNTIGTYILQLTDTNNKQIHFVSADFLGNEVSN